MGPAKPAKRGRGRPPKQKRDALEEAAHVIDVALAVRLKHLWRLKQLEFTEAAALRFVMKRRRGRTGEYIGATVNELLGAIENKTQAALRLVVEHDLPVAQAARCLGIDLRNLRKLVPEARQAAQIEADRKIKFAASTQVQDLFFLPKNTTPEKSD
jgi:hypothetical protein